jgi:Protein of unknown function (DUF3309)
MRATSRKLWELIRLLRVCSAFIGEGLPQLSLGTIILIILILALLGALPTWPYSSEWGYYPSGGLGLIVIILLVLILMGRV